MSKGEHVFMVAMALGCMMMLGYVGKQIWGEAQNRSADRDRKIQFCYDRGGAANLGADLEFKGCYGVMGSNK